MTKATIYLSAPIVRELLKDNPAYLEVTQKTLKQALDHMDDKEIKDRIKDQIKRELNTGWNGYSSQVSKLAEKTIHKDAESAVRLANKDLIKTALESASNTFEKRCTKIMDETMERHRQSVSEVVKTAFWKEMGKLKGIAKE